MCQDKTTLSRQSSRGHVHDGSVHGRLIEFSDSQIDDGRPFFALARGGFRGVAIRRREPSVAMDGHWKASHDQAADSTIY
jgi:hypothetical protein